MQKLWSARAHGRRWTLRAAPASDRLVRGPARGRAGGRGQRVLETTLASPSPAMPGPQRRAVAELEGGQNSASGCQVWEFGPRAPPGALGGRGREIDGSLPEARRVCTPTHLLSHPGCVLGEVAHFPHQETLTFLQGREESWAGKSPKASSPVPHAWHHQDRLSCLSWEPPGEGAGLENPRV